MQGRCRQKLLRRSNFVQYLKDRGIAHVAIDSDNENSTLKRFHPDVQFLDLANHAQLDGIFRSLEKASLVVVDCRAASSELFLRLLSSKSMPQLCSRRSARF